MSDGQHGTATLIKLNLGEVTTINKIPMSITTKLEDLGLEITNLYVSWQLQPYENLIKQAI